jgi:hypothetical protein
MASNKIFRFGPAAVSSSVANILNPTVTSLSGPVGFTMTQPYLVVRHIRIVNKTAASVNFSGYIGATGASAAGTEFLGTLLPIAAYSAYDWYGMVRLDAADFFTGIASAATSLTIQGEGEIGII